MEYLCRAFLKQILQGLLHIHNRGVIHRDIKLENIMLCDNTNNSHITGSGTGTANGQHTGKNQVKIIDFGLAMLAPVTPSDPTSGHKKQSQQPVGKNTPPPAGTKGYHSPEVLLYRDYTPACDIWATGVVLFLLLIRDYPFLCYSGSLNEKGQEWDEAACIRGDYLANLTTQKKVDTWNDLSLEAKHLIKRLLDVNPVTRITAKEALMHPWICGVHGTTSSGTSCSGKHSVDGHHQEHSLPAYADVDIDAIDMSNVGLNANTNSEPYIHTQTRLSPLYFSSMDPDHVQSLTSAEFAHVSNGLHASESASASSRLERLSEEEEVDEEEEEESSTNTVHPVSSSNSSKLHRKKATVTSTATGTCIDIDTGISSENADILSEIHSFRERQRAMLSTGLTVVRAAMRFKSKKATNPQVAKRREMEQDETEGRGTGAKSSIKRSKASSSIHSSTILKSTPQSRNTGRGTCTGNGTGTGTTGTDTSTDTGTDTGIGYHLSHV